LIKELNKPNDIFELHEHNDIFEFYTFKKI